MRYIKWRILIVTSIVCLLPILLGTALWDKLPDTMAIHFDINNNPDNFASKGFVVFGMPFFMAMLQMICCFINDVNSYKHGAVVKVERVTKWIIPVMAIVLHTITLCFGLGWNIDIRKFAVFIVGVLFVVTGNYLPKLDYVKNYKLNKEKARKINRFIGFETVVMGVLFLISIVFPPRVSVVCLFLMVPYTIIAVWYTIRVAKK